MVLPRPSSSLYACLEQRELVGPRGEAAHPAELIQLAEYRHQRVVGRLVGEVVELCGADVTELIASPC